jgi:hypothetical protein
MNVANNHIVLSVLRKSGLLERVAVDCMTEQQTRRQALLSEIRDARREWPERIQAAAAKRAEAEAAYLEAKSRCATALHHLNECGIALSGVESSMAKAVSKPVAELRLHADARVYALINWCDGVLDSVRHLCRTQLHVRRDVLGRNVSTATSNTKEVQRAMDIIKAVRERADALLTADYGVDPKGGLESMRDAVLAAIRDFKDDLRVDPLDISQFGVTEFNHPV